MGTKTSASISVEEQRTAATDAIVASTHRKKLIIAGPGTGKTFTFSRALAAACSADSEERGLALTFIRNLVADLAKDLGELAGVFTFHGYCKYLMHKHDVAGLQQGDYYPPLLDLLIEDVRALDGRVIDRDDVEARLHNLDETDDLIETVLVRADYYNAVSHTDLVYRVLRHFKAHPGSIPRYPLIVVDEYQDFSFLETSFIALLATQSPVLVAGDDDQALYARLKHASPEFLRALARGDEYQLFPLPYCSRCTAVIVAAVNDVIGKATPTGHLIGRIEKPFLTYPPEKQADSDAHPKIIHVDCSTANMPYAGQYIAQQIGRIPAVDITISGQKRHLTALVVGPNPFLQRAFDVVRERLPQARMKTSPRVVIDLLDGYKRIAQTGSSQLGWRIVMECRPFKGSLDILRQALGGNSGLRELLHEAYVTEHSELAQLVGVLLANQVLSPEDEAKLCAAAERSLDQIKEFLSIEEAGEDVPGADSQSETTDAPDILFTSLVGSKGLSAEHVFIVGLNDGHFPRDRSSITDDEICNLLVALSRTRKRCHVISCRFFGRGWLRKSVFLDWIQRHLEPIVVNKDYDFSG